MEMPIKFSMVLRKHHKLYPFSARFHLLKLLVSIFPLAYSFIHIFFPSKILFSTLLEKIGRDLNKVVKGLGYVSTIYF